MDELKTIIFRTDRIGDFLISCPFILSYLKKYKKSEIVIISSEYNYQYIKNFEFIKNVISLKNETKFLPKILILIKMIIILRKNKYFNVIVLDGKKRSFFISLFLKGNKSILLQSKGLEFLSKLFKYKNVINYELQNQFKNFSFLSSLLDFNINHKEINIYNNYIFTKKFKLDKKYILIHLDEKWYSKYYYRDFTDINPNKEDLKVFIKNIQKILNDKFDVVITTGSKKIDTIEQYTSDFTTIEDNILIKKEDNNSVIFYKNTTFNNLEYLIKNSSLLICCEGGVSHVSHNFNIKTIAFFQKNRLQHTKFWTGHMENVNLYERAKMKEIINDNNFYHLIKENLPSEQ